MYMVVVIVTVWWSYPARNGAPLQGQTMLLPSFIGSIHVKNTNTLTMLNICNRGIPPRVQQEYPLHLVVAMIMPDEPNDHPPKHEGPTIASNCREPTYGFQHSILLKTLTNCYSDPTKYLPIH